MKYYLLNKDCEYQTPVVMKLNVTTEKIVASMSRLVRKQAELDLKMIKELAKINNMSEDEVSDTLATYDFLVDSSQYGLADLVTEISKEEYDKIKEDKYEHKI